MKIIISNLKMLGAIIYGYYDINKNEININKRLKLSKKILVFMHEYFHYLIIKFHLGNDYNFLVDYITFLIMKKNKKNNIIDTFNYYYNNKGEKYE